MTEDARLSDFVGESTSESESESDLDRDIGSSSAKDSDVASDVTPAQPTYAWGGYTCAECDRSVERVWMAADEFVCEECKSW